jgi:hypothetical protein
MCVYVCVCVRGGEEGKCTLLSQTHTCISDTKIFETDQGIDIHVHINTQTCMCVCVCVWSRVPGEHKKRSDISNCPSPFRRAFSQKDTFLKKGVGGGGLVVRGCERLGKRGRV